MNKRLRVYLLCHFPREILYHTLWTVDPLTFVILAEICSRRREACKEGELRRTPVRRREPDQRFAASGAKICQNQVYKGFMRLRPRCISIGQLKGRYPLTLPTYLTGRLPDTLLAYAMRYLILRPASRLDAFSGYPIRTWLPSFYSWRNNWFTSGSSIPVLSY